MEIFAALCFFGILHYEKFYDFFAFLKTQKLFFFQNCIDNFFRDNSVFGMKKATLQSISKDADDLRKRDFFIVGEWAALVNVTMTPAENSVFDPNQTETSFYLILKQQNGRYLIDEFATGL